MSERAKSEPLPTVRVTREEFVRRAWDPRIPGWKYLYRVQGVKRPTHSLDQVRRIAFKKHGKCRLVYEWELGS